MSDQPGGDVPPSPGVAAAVGDDPLDRLRRDLEELDGVPVGERVARFRRVNDALARELAQLDEV